MCSQNGVCLQDIYKYKARLIAQGFTQTEGLDYNETYSHVARFTSIRTLLALSATFGYYVHQMDVETALLNGELKKERYVVLPDGWLFKERNVLNVIKALYSLKSLEHVLVSKGFQTSYIDTFIYICKSDRGTVILVV